MAAFPDTHWTLILRGRTSPAARAEAIEELARGYWRPLYLRGRRKGLDREEAEDAVQSLLARLIERDALERADPARGRFRSYVCTAFDHMLASDFERRSAVKRGGHAVVIRIDAELADRELGADGHDPDAAFLREWALAVMERAVAALEAEFRDGRRAGPFELVRLYLGTGPEPPSYEEAAAAHGMTVSRLKSLLHRTRLRFRELVRLEIAETVADASEVDAEMRTLVEALAR